MSILNLVVVAHPDDEVLGFGATGAKLVSQGEKVQPIILCGNVDVRSNRPEDGELLTDIRNANAILGFETPILGGFPNIRMNTIDHLQIVQYIEKQIIEFRPSRIFTHHPSDLNDDHLRVSKACMVASRLFQRNSDVHPIESLYCMEVLSSTDWNFSLNSETYIPNTFVEVEEYMDVKLKALSAYRNVMRDYPHPRSSTVVTALAALRGGQAGLNYAESFQSIFRRGVL